MCHKVLNYIKKGGPGKSLTFGGLILNISATLHYTASWYQIHVAVAKVAVDAVTRNLALEWGTDYDIKMHKQYFEGIPPLVSGLDTTKKEELQNQFSVVPDDLILFAVGYYAEVNKTLDRLRTYVAHKLGLIDNVSI
ncbi:Peroxisomal 2,4-dienoyl-CoA reductase [Capsicum annuum]|nr:Peroxisomal 2,4-dienoyl-CoA reductase [Capsicum annuum]KAF3681636.1 Peroxisomal 2,4-dienoyl-CoA reductase [Capsicum annuum]